MPASDRIPPEHWPDCIGYNEWFFPTDPPPEPEQRADKQVARQEFWPEFDPCVYPFCPEQLEHPHRDGYPQYD
jgi:hypothetical protein